MLWTMTRLSRMVFLPDSRDESPLHAARVLGRREESIFEHGLGNRCPVVKQKVNQ